MCAARNRPSELQAKDQPYWEIFEAASDGLIVHDPETLRILEANDAAAAMHGYVREDFIGLHITDYVHAGQPAPAERFRAAS